MPTSEWAHFRQCGLDVVAVTRRLTPWRPAVTARPERFEFTGRGQTLQVVAGENSCQLELGTRRIVQTVGGSSVTLSQLYNIRLPRWTSVEPPFVDAHPFFLLHLMATGQVDFNELMARAMTISAGTTRSTLAIRQPCAILRMMGRQQFALRLSTNFDLSTAQD